MTSLSMSSQSRKTRIEELLQLEFGWPLDTFLSLCSVSRICEKAIGRVDSKAFRQTEDLEESFADARAEKKKKLTRAFNFIDPHTHTTPNQLKRTAITTWTLFLLLFFSLPHHRRLADSYTQSQFLCAQLTDLFSAARVQCLTNFQSPKVHVFTREKLFLTFLFAFESQPAILRFLISLWTLFECSIV